MRNFPNSKAILLDKPEEYNLAFACATNIKITLLSGKINIAWVSAYMNDVHCVYGLNSKEKRIIKTKAVSFECSEITESNREIFLNAATKFVELIKIETTLVDIKINDPEIRRILALSFDKDNVVADYVLLPDRQTECHLYINERASKIVFVSKNMMRCRRQIFTISHETNNIYDLKLSEHIKFLVKHSEIDMLKKIKPNTKDPIEVKSMYYEITDDTGVDEHESVILTLLTYYKPTELLIKPMPVVVDSVLGNIIKQYKYTMFNSFQLIGTPEILERNQW